MTRIDELIDGIYRISTTVALPGGDFTFNQFLIEDDRPALIRTGLYQQYDEVRAAISQVLDPATLGYVILLHFEADECGGMDRFLAAAAESTLAGSAMSADVNLAGWDYRGRVEGHRDGEVTRCRISYAPSGKNHSPTAADCWDGSCRAKSRPRADEHS